MDSDPIVSHDRADFLKLYEQLMNQEVYLTSGDELKAYSMRQMVEARRDVPQPRGDTFSLEQFEFQQVKKGEWRFVLAYLEE